jgi:hypothetical protein
LISRAGTQVKPSVSEDSLSVTELRRWNDMYGRGGRGSRTRFGFGGLDDAAAGGGRPTA